MPLPPYDRSRSEDPFLDIVREIQAANLANPGDRLCDCVNDEKNVCGHIQEMAIQKLRQIDGDPQDWDSYHDSFPARFPTEAKHGTKERRKALQLRVKQGENTHHPGDRPMDPDGMLEDVAEDERWWE